MPNELHGNPNQLWTSGVGDRPSSACPEHMNALIEKSKNSWIKVFSRPTQHPDIGEMQSSSARIKKSEMNGPRTTLAVLWIALSLVAY